MAEEKKPFTEELMIKGSELVGRVKELIAEGNVRKIVVLKENGDVLFEVPIRLENNKIYYKMVYDNNQI